jgi:HK97 gp10 family phage protein
MSDFQFLVVGDKELQARLDKAADSLKAEVQAKIQYGAQQIAAEAKQRTSQFSGGYTVGFLRNHIGASPVPDGYQVVSAAEYSAYVEFGTGTKVSVPEGLEEFAIQFKGTKAVPGMRAQPYFFPA